MRPRRCDAGELEFGGGLEVLLGALLAASAPGEAIDIVVAARSTALELPGWALAAGHEADEPRAEEGGKRFVVRLHKGRAARVLGAELPRRGPGMPLRKQGGAHSGDLRWRAGVPETLDPNAGFVPIGTIAEAGGPPFSWTLNERDQIWADEVADLAERASAAQWDGTSDIPWALATGLPDEIEQAVAQVMAFIAQNEYVALYVPARFLPTVNPGFTEVLMWLSSHVHDEARHVEVFTKRMLVGGAHAYALAATQLSLHSLLEEKSFPAASLLLNVLGEGSFLDLLRFVERYAPDPATAAAARLAHRDEQRHVHFGIAHVRRVLRLQPHAREKLVSAVEGRAAKLVSLTGLSPILQESLTMMASGSPSASTLSEAARAVRKLRADMETNRIRRLLSAGFDDATARHLSDLHTPNLM